MPHPSLAVAVPSAPLIAAAFGLQPRAKALPPEVITGAVTSAVQVIVLDTVAEFPQPSVARNVLVCDLVHELLETAPSVAVTVGTLQPSEAVADPSAFVISETCGLHPIFCVVYIPVKTGTVLSAVHVTVLDVVEVLPHASIAVKVLV